MDTIFAEATARGKAGVAVVRISGPQAFQAVKNLAGDTPEPRRASLRVLRDGAGERIDEALVLSFTQGASFTGEDVVELHLHGSVAIVRAVLDMLSGMNGLRMAEAGEFTRRAMENERLDLAQIEGLADLIDAETEMQRKQAMRVFSGALGDKVARWRKKLLRAAALLEATIDFADEEVPTDVTPEVLELLTSVDADLVEEIAGFGIAERIREGFEVAIVGPPNVGKSTLLNALAGRDAAITSDIAGTTRDVIEVRMDLAGLPVTVLDTAGIRESEDYVEALGIDRARDRATQADIRVFLVNQPGDTPEIPMEDGDILLVGKDDEGQLGAQSVSGQSGHGLSSLIKRVSQELEGRSKSSSVSTHQRHRDAMQNALASMSEAREEIHAGGDRTEFAAEYLRAAIHDMDCLVGRIDVESILGEIFSSFCIGK